jgi:eukaryotic-like serine/threonine-protein kinase
MSVAVDGYRGSAGSSPDDVATVNQDQTVVELVCPSRLPMMPPRGHLPPGTRAGDYEMAEEVGHGAFGTVYRAVHPIIGKEVAVKVLDGLVMRDDQLERRFVTEARAVNRIKHPNIVDIFGFGQLENGRTFYVMELLVGETLAKLLKRGALPPLAALAILEPLADALDAAHRVGVLHRDLKPANVFLHQPPGEAARVKLLDFGVAKILEPGSEPNATASGAALGTPAYMAPEQWSSGSTNASSDIYSLGLIAYELLTGSRPYRGSGTHELVKAHLFDRPDASSSINPALPAAIDAPLAAMLAKQPDARPSSAREAVAALRTALSKTERHASRASLPRPLTGRTPTALARPALILLVMAALAATAALAWRAARQGPASPAEARSTTPRSTSSIAPLQVDVNAPAAPRVPEPPPEARAAVTPRPEEQVTVVVRGAPARAVVFLNGVRIATAAEPLRVPRGSEGLTLSLEADGVLLRSYRVVPDRDRVVTFLPSRRVGPIVQSVHPKSELEF